MIGASIATQNIQRDLAFLGKVAPVASARQGQTPAPVKESQTANASQKTEAVASTREASETRFLVLSNTKTPTSRLTVAVPSLLSRAKSVALESFTVHSLYSGAPGVSGVADVVLGMDGRSMVFPLATNIPYGKYDNDQFVTELETALNQNARKAKADYRIGGTVPCTAFYKSSAPDISQDVYAAHTTYVETDGTALPVAGIRSVIAANEGKVVVVQKAKMGPNWVFACTSIPSGRFMKEFPVRNAPCIAILPKPIYVSGLLESKPISRAVVMAMDTSQIPNDRRGVYDHIVRVRKAQIEKKDPKPHTNDVAELENMTTPTREIPLCVTGIAIEALATTDQVFITAYDYPEDPQHMYIRLATGEHTLENAEPGDGGGSTMRVECDLFDFAVDAVKNTRPRTDWERANVPRGFTDDGTIGNCFRVFNGQSLARFIGEHGPTKVRVEDVGPFSTKEQRVYDWSMVLAETYLSKFTGAIDGSAEGYARLLDSVRANPTRFGEMCNEMVIVTLSPMAKHSPMENFMEAIRLNSGVAEFALSGPGAKTLGLVFSKSRDAGQRMYQHTPLFRFTRLSGSCGIQFVCGFPTSLVDHSGHPTPKRLTSHLFVNGARMQGHMFSGRQFAEIPTRKALRDVYESKMAVGVKLQGASTEIGMDIEDGEGARVYGEFTAVIRVET